MELSKNISKLCLKEKKGNISTVTEITYNGEGSPRFIVKRITDSSCEGGGIVRSNVTVYYKSQFSYFQKENIKFLDINKYSSQEEKNLCLTYNEYLKMY